MLRREIFIIVVDSYDRMMYTTEVWKANIPYGNMVQLTYKNSRTYKTALSKAIDFASGFREAGHRAYIMERIKKVPNL